MLMPGRWSVLALLFAVRATMGFQYQSVAALSPLIARDWGVGHAEIGLLVGLYLAPGIALAYPGGAVGRRFGDKNVVLAGIALMVAGGAIMAFFPSWEAQIEGRLVAGMGGVLLNVLMSKMLTDWFAGHEIATAMAVFVNSWPVGIALALVVLPVVAETLGVPGAYLFATLPIALGMAALAMWYSAPPVQAAAVSDDEGGPLVGVPLRATAVAGILWGLYNIGFAMLFAFGPAMLVERNWSVTKAGAASSIVLWLAMISVPLGGFLADRLRLYGAFIVSGCLASAVLLLLAARDDNVVLLFVALGFICGLPAGPIMSLPARVLTPQMRAVGMGLFFTVFYAAMVLGPALGGWVAMWTGRAASAFDFGAACLIACVPAMVAFTYLAAPTDAATLQRRPGTPGPNG
jgi:MFS family permease